MKRGGMILITQGPLLKTNNCFCLVNLLSNSRMPHMKHHPSPDKYIKMIPTKYTRLSESL